MSLDDSNPLSIIGRGMGFDLEPSPDEWEQLTEFAQRFIAAQLEGLAEKPVIDSSTDPDQGMLGH